jgi:hypothetical protein
MSFNEHVYKVDNLDNILNYTFDDGTPIWLYLRFRLRLKYMSLSQLNTETLCQEK